MQGDKAGPPYGKKQKAVFETKGLTTQSDKKVEFSNHSKNEAYSEKP